MMPQGSGMESQSASLTKPSLSSDIVEVKAEKVETWTQSADKDIGFENVYDSCIVNIKSEPETVFFKDNVTVTQSGQSSESSDRDEPQTFEGTVREEEAIYDTDSGTIRLSTGETIRVKRELSPTPPESKTKRHCHHNSQVLGLKECSVRLSPLPNDYNLTNGKINCKEHLQEVQKAKQHHTSDLLNLFGTENMVLQEVSDVEQNLLINVKCEDPDPYFEENGVTVQHKPMCSGDGNDEGDEAVHGKLVDSSKPAINSLGQDISTEELKYAAEWTEDLRWYPLVPPFTSEPGLNCLGQLGDNATPLSFFHLFVTTDVVKNITKETNCYAYSMCRDKEASSDPYAKSIVADWTPASANEIRCFLAICLHMGLVQLHRINDYWSDSMAVKTAYARALMKIDRFRSILSFLHVNDNATRIPVGQVGYDVLHKIRPFYNHLRYVFKSLYVPEQNIAMKKIACLWKGRGDMNVCMTENSSKFGIQFHQVCETSSGYVYDFEVQAAPPPGASISPATTCHHLLSPLKNKGYTVYLGDHYCCPVLAEALASEGTMVVGTCSSDKWGLPADLHQAVLRTGEQMYRRKGQVLAVKWRDESEKEVCILTTVHMPVMMPVESGTQDIGKPAAIVSFFKNMAGLPGSELFEFMPTYFHTLKWWKKLFFYLLTLTVMQAHILHNKYLERKREKPWTVDRFWVRLLDEMGRALAHEQNRDAVLPDAALVCHAAPHYIDDLPEIMKRRQALRRCKLCSKKVKKIPGYKEKYTPYWCAKCQVALCATPCFKMWHIEKSQQ